MKKIILLVEDLDEEREKAKEILQKEGFVCVATSTLAGAERMLGSFEGKLSGIITDLHFPEMDQKHPKNSPELPCGLAVVSEAVLRGIPVVVCSNINSHFAEYPRKVIQALEKLGKVSIPFGMDSKNWEKAVNDLKNILEKKEEVK